MTENPSKIRTVTMPITPTQARTWLEKNTHNRNIVQDVVNAYARDMAMGRWVITHQGIAIADDGRVIDGQHRLWAITECEKTIVMQVTTGLPMSAQTAVDGQRVRSTRDVLALRDGIKHPSDAIGTARLLATQLGVERPTREEQIDCYDIYKVAITRAVQMFPRRVVRIQNAHVLCVITRAIERGENQEMIRRFVHTLAEGVPPPDAAAQPHRDSIVVKLRNFLLEPRALPRRSDIYGKTARALRAYIDGERLSTIYPATDELFPLKSERPSKKPKPPAIRNSVRRKRGVDIPYTSPAVATAAAKKTKFTNTPRMAS